MAFLTLEDPNAKIKGSVDPLGIQPIWIAFARHVVTNLTTQTTSVRNFTILLLGRYFAEQLIEERSVPREEALNVFLRMEQIGAYVRHVAHGVGGDIRGIERVRGFLHEGKGQVLIQPNSQGMILSDQKVYGLWGLYSVSARVSGLIPEGPVGVTQEARKFIDENYLPRLNGTLRPLLRLLSRGGRLDTKKMNPVMKSLAAILPESFTQKEIDFYGRYLRDALEVGRDGSQHGKSGRQAHFRNLLENHTNLETKTGREELLKLSGAAHQAEEGLSRSLERIGRLEAFSAPATALFDYSLAQTGRHPREVAKSLTEHWGEQIPNLNRAAFSELLPEIRECSSSTLATEMNRCHEALISGKYVEAIRSLLKWNEIVMAGRNASPWGRISENGKIDVRYRGQEHLLPNRDELPTLWRNAYFIDSLKSITHQLRNLA